jgi:hypothetical protein
LSIDDNIDMSMIPSVLCLDSHRTTYVERSTPSTSNITRTTVEMTRSLSTISFIDNKCNPRMSSDYSFVVFLTLSCVQRLNMCGLNEIYNDIDTERTLTFYCNRTYNNHWKRTTKTKNDQQWKHIDHSHMNEYARYVRLR